MRRRFFVSLLYFVAHYLNGTPTLRHRIKVSMNYLSFVLILMRSEKSNLFFFLSFDFLPFSRLFFFHSFSSYFIIEIDSIGSDGSLLPNWNFQLYDRTFNKWEPNNLSADITIIKWTLLAIAIVVALWRFCCYHFDFYFIFVISYCVCISHICILFWWWATTTTSSVRIMITCYFNFFPYLLIHLLWSKQYRPNVAEQLNMQLFKQNNNILNAIHIATWAFQLLLCYKQ